MARWEKGERTVAYLVGQGRLESFEAEDLGALADALIGRAAWRVETTAAAAGHCALRGQPVSVREPHCCPSSWCRELWRVP